MDVVRLFVYAPGKKSMINRLFSYLSFNALATATGLSSRMPWDVILCTNGSFFTGITSWLIGAGKAIPFIYNVQDLYPEVPIRAGQLRSRPAIATLKKIGQFMYRKAAHITVIAPSFRDHLVAAGVPAEKVSVIPNFVDTDFIRPLPRVNDFSRDHGLADKFVVSYAGNLGYVYDLVTMLEAAAILSSEKDILFLIVGNGVAKSELERKASDLKLENVRFWPFQSYENLPWLRASSDIQVSLYRRGSANDSVPSKVYEIMASGRPLVASSDAGSDVWKLVETAQCGLCIKPEDAKQLAEAIITLYRNPSLRDSMAQRGCRHAEQHHSKRAAVARYNELLRQVCSQGA
jgi:colanic acid biosynthesis glycosyl transferase WcaI